MDSKVMTVVRELRAKISSKYIIEDLRLFGSSARGDRRNSSDIDILVRLPKLNPSIEEDMFDMAYDLELTHDCVIDLIAVSGGDLKNNAARVPVYRNILTEGIAV